MTNQICIGEVIVNGIVFDPKRTSQSRELNVNELLAAVPNLFDLLRDRGVDYLLVGGIAMLAYVEGRNTQDINLILSSADLLKAPELQVDDRNAQFVRARYGQLQVDLLLSDDPFFAFVKAHHSVTKSFVERTICCASLEGLLLFKLFALPSLYRQGQFARVELYERDITMLLHDYPVDMAVVFQQLAPHVSLSDLAEIQQIVAEIEAKIAKAGRRFRDA